MTVILNRALNWFHDGFRIGSGMTGELRKGALECV